MKTDPITVALIVLSNAVAIAVAWRQHWSLMLLIWPYWIQNVVIGWYNYRRILALKRFVPDGQVTGSDEYVKQWNAKFFFYHYGGIHFGYFLGLVIYTQVKLVDISLLDVACIAALGVVFAFTHRTSFKRNLENDLRGCPEINTLFFLPYLRVVPMHLMMVIGLSLGYTGAILLFGTLKTIADVAMHIVEHRILGAPAK